MTLTLTEIKTRFRQYTLSNGSAYAHWSDSTATDLANDAQFEVFKQLAETFEEVYFVTYKDGITPSNGEINLEAELVAEPMYRMLSLGKRSSSTSSHYQPVTIVTPREALRQPSAFYPERWYVVGKKLKRDGEVESGATYRIVYQRRVPKLLKDGDATEIPVEFADMIPLKMAYLAALQARQKEDATFFGAEYEKRVAEMRKTAANRIMAIQRSVIDVEGTNFPGPAPGIYVVT